MYNKIYSAENFSTLLDVIPRELGQFWKFGVDELRKSHEISILCLHGIESHSGWFESLFQVMSDECDFYGWDRVNSNKFLLCGVKEQLEAMGRILEFLQKRYKKIIILGNSWGGVLAMFFAKHPVLAKFSFEVTAVAPVLFLRKKFFLPWMDLRSSFKFGNIFFYHPFRVYDFTDHPMVRNLILEDGGRRKSISMASAWEILRIKQNVFDGGFESDENVDRKIRVILPLKDQILDYKKTWRWLVKNKIFFVNAPNHHAIILEDPSFLASEIIL